MATELHPSNLLIAPLNHLLRQSGWACRLLAPFAGRVAAITISKPLPRLLFIIADGGLLSAAGPELEPTVEIILPEDLPRLLLLDRQSIFASASISGSADFAEALAKVFRNLRWDAEADLSRVCGDLLAHRALHTVRTMLSWKLDSSKRVALNLSEYAHEQRLLLGTSELRVLDSGVNDIMVRSESLEQRLGQLEQRRS